MSGCLVFRSVYSMGLSPDTQDCGLRMRRECQERFPHHRFQRKPPVSDPGMHHVTCVTHVPWCMSWLLTRSDGEMLPAFRCMRNPQFYVSGKIPTLIVIGKSDGQADILSLCHTMYINVHDMRVACHLWWLQINHYHLYIWIWWGTGVISWWRHDIEKVSTLLYNCETNAQVVGEFLLQRANDADLSCFRYC